MSGDLWASRLLMSQWPNSTGADRISEATQFSISPAPASTSAASKKGEGTTRQLAHFGQPLVEAFFSRHPSTIETRKEIRNSSVFSRNKTNKKTILAQLRGDQDKERDGVGGALRMLGNGADFPIGPKQAVYLQPKPLLFADLPCLVEQHWDVMEVSQIRRPVHPLQAIEAE